MPARTDALKREVSAAFQELIMNAKWQAALGTALPPDAKIEAYILREQSVVLAVEDGKGGERCFEFKMTEHG